MGSMTEVIDHFEHNGFNANDLDFVPIKIPKNVFDPDDATGLIKRGPSNLPNTDFFKINTEQFDTINELMRRGLVQIGK